MDWMFFSQLLWGLVLVDLADDFIATDVELDGEKGLFLGF
jgi:hypothetical protein